MVQDDVGLPHTIQGLRPGLPELNVENEPQAVQELILPLAECQELYAVSGARTHQNGPETISGRTA